MDGNGVASVGFRDAGDVAGLVGCESFSGLVVRSIHGTLMCLLMTVSTCCLW